MNIESIIIRNFFRLLRAGLFGQEEPIEVMSGWKWKRLYLLACVHGVPALLLDGVNRCAGQYAVELPEGLADEWNRLKDEMEREHRRQQTAMISLFSVFSHQQWRPMLFKGLALSALYDRPEHRTPGAIDVFFPFETQGRKADEWARANSQQSEQRDRHVLGYQWNGVPVSHYHRVMKLTNSLHNRTLQNLIEKDIRESSPSYIMVDGARLETLSPTLTLLLVLLRISRGLLSDGQLLPQLADLGVFLRKVGDRVDYVQLQEWTDRLRLQRMAQLAGVLLVELLGFSADEVPFMTAENAGAEKGAERVVEELLSWRRSRTDDWFFQQQSGDIFVHTANTSAMFWQVRHSARYFRYYPSESFTSLFSSFAHSLSHIEE